MKGLQCCERHLKFGQLAAAFHKYVQTLSCSLGDRQYLFQTLSFMRCLSPSIVLELPVPLKTCGSVELMCSKPSIMRTVAIREVLTHLGEKSKPLSLLQLAQLVLYSPTSSSPLELLNSGELKSLHLAFLSVIACIKITANADYSCYAQALPKDTKC